MKKIIALTVAVFCAATAIAQNTTAAERKLDSLKNVEKNIINDMNIEKTRILDNIATAFVVKNITSGESNRVVKIIDGSLDAFIDEYPKIQEAKASLALMQPEIEKAQFVKDFAKMSARDFDAKYMSSDPEHFINPPSLTNTALIMVEEALKNSTYQAAGEKFQFSKVMTYAFYTYYLKEFFQMKGSFTPEKYQDFGLNIFNKSRIEKSKKTDIDEVLITYNELSNIMSRGHLNTITKNLGVNDMYKVDKTIIIYAKLFQDHKGSRAWESRDSFQAAVITGIINLLNTNIIEEYDYFDVYIHDTFRANKGVDNLFANFFNVAQYMDFSKMDKAQKDALIKAVEAKKDSSNKHVKKLRKLLQENNIMY
ncbi:hypothetical protein AAIR98_001041 [Elusimicrobium simillimum]|uniref:hypothetical protein n=1 Tax=Elusimicrobium simillimum TaxID=3143438 RepID=UPI003C6F1ADC